MRGHDGRKGKKEGTEEIKGKVADCRKGDKDVRRHGRDGRRRMMEDELQ
jgi:hypothetical protein